MKKIILSLMTAAAILISVLIHISADEMNTVHTSGKFESINRNKSSIDEPPMCGNGVKWGNIGVFKRPGRNPKIISLLTIKNGDIIIAEDEDDKGHVVRLSGADYNKVIWRKKLESENIQSIVHDPTDATFTVLYRTVRSKQYHLEIRKTSNGAILHEITDGKIEDCEYEGGFSAFNAVYSNNGRYLAVNYQGVGGQCTKIKMQNYIGLIDIKNGTVLHRAFYLNDAWEEFGKKYNPIWLALAFDRTDQYLYMGSLGTFIFRYPVATMKKPWFKSFFAESEKVCSDASVEIQSLIVDKDGSLLYTTGGQGIGDMFRLSADMKTVTHLGTNSGASFVYTAYSPDLSMFMANSNSFNIWNMNSQKYILYGYGLNSSIARFHPLKRAVIYASGSFISIVSELHYSQKHITGSFTGTGHYLTAYTDYHIQGSGNIWWAYGSRKWDDPDYYKKDEYGSGMLTFGKRIGNDESVLPQSSELRLKTSQPGSFTICGGTKQAMSAAETLENLPSWGR